MSLRLSSDCDITKDVKLINMIKTLFEYLLQNKVESVCKTLKLL